MKKLSIAALTFWTSLAMADLESMRARIPQITELKDKGVIGEQADGFLGVVKPDGAAQAVVDAENKDRRAEYEKRAASQGQTLDVLAKVLGSARLDKEKPGRMIRGASGTWTAK